jgi:catechol 2,3-dioxygenase-like lactoylglutathione lyase family enzyme
MRKIQTQGVHHITLVGADRQTSIDFWEGVLAPKDPYQAGRSTWLHTS